MVIAVYQINMERDSDRVAFASLEYLEKYQGSPEINSVLYDKVYEGEVNCSGLESVFRLLNLDHPLDYGGRSLSVSDIVEVKSGPVEPGFYFCDSISFQKVDFKPELARPAVPETIRVVLLEPGKEARTVDLLASLPGLQRAVDGRIEAIPLPDTEAVLICNADGKNRGLPLNRVIREPEAREEVSYREMVSRFRTAAQEKRLLSGCVVFTKDSFDRPYSELSRTYEISNSSKAFQPDMNGYSIFGSCRDGTDPCVRLDGYMADEKGGKNGWRIERCYFKEDRREILDVISGTCFLCGQDGDRFTSLTEEQALDLGQVFKYPERISQTREGIEAIPYKPKESSKER